MREGWDKKSINEICNKASSNIAQNKIININGNYPVYGASGYVQNVDFYHIDSEYIGIVKDGAGVGRVNVYPAFSSLLGTMQYIIPKKGYNLRYVAYALKGLNLSTFASGATIPHIYFKDYGKCKIPVPPLPEQERIVSELDLLASIIDKKKEQLKEYDKLAQSIFYDMFGDPIQNEKGWEVKKLGDCLSYIKNGANIKQTKGAIGIPVTRIETLAGGIFNRDRLGYANIFSTEKYIQNILNDGDILMSHINSKAYIGRSVLYKRQNDEQIIHGINLLRLKSNPSIIISTYLNIIFQTNYFRNNVAKIRKDAVNQSSMTISDLIKISIPIPPLLLQQSFAEKVEAIEKQKMLIQQSINETQTLFNSRMDYYFG
ncbi:MAG: restriction endonuclease subunit S [Bacteroidetes bacterium]|nr:restriction endonuclease subunit S [Bacteroidota bacterium]